MTAKQRFMEQAVERQRRHPKTAPKIISFSLAMAFFGLSVIFIGVAHGYHMHNITTSWIASMLMVLSILTLQGCVVCSALGVTSTRYTLHCICGTTLALSLAFDLLLILYYTLCVL